MFSFFCVLTRLELLSASLGVVSNLTLSSNTGGRGGLGAVCRLVSVLIGGGGGMFAGEIGGGCIKGGAGGGGAGGGGAFAASLGGVNVGISPLYFVASP